MPDFKIQNPRPSHKITYLTAKYDQREYLKNHGCKFSNIYKLWYIAKNNPHHDKITTQFVYEPYDIVYLNVPFADRSEAREKGCSWDSYNKLWFSTHGKLGFEKWLFTDHNQTLPTDTETPDVEIY